MSRLRQISVHKGLPSWLRDVRKLRPKGAMWLEIQVPLTEANSFYYAEARDVNRFKRRQMKANQTRGDKDA